MSPANAAEASGVNTPANEQGNGESSPRFPQEIGARADGVAPLKSLLPESSNHAGLLAGAVLHGNAEDGAGSFPEFISHKSGKRGRERWMLSRIVNRLRLAAGGIVTPAELIDLLWSGDPEGGPIDPLTTLYVSVHSLRKFGYPIRSVHGRGYFYQHSEWEVTP